MLPFFFLLERKERMDIFAVFRLATQRDLFLEFLASKTYSDLFFYLSTRNSESSMLILQEDDKVRELVAVYGPRKWSVIASKLNGRIGKQCRERYVFEFLYLNHCSFPFKISVLPIIYRTEKRKTDLRFFFTFLAGTIILILILSRLPGLRRRIV